MTELRLMLPCADLARMDGPLMFGWFGKNAHLGQRTHGEVNRLFPHFGGGRNQDLLIHEDLCNQHGKSNAPLRVFGLCSHHQQITNYKRKINGSIVNDSINHVFLELGDCMLMCHSIQVVCKHPVDKPNQRVILCDFMSGTPIVVLEVDAHGHG